MINKKNTLSLLFSLLFTSSIAQADSAAKNHSLYLGALGGYGSTTWEGLVSTTQNDALNLSAPIDAKEGGGVAGFFTGYEFSPYFAVEASYIHFPSATIYFDQQSLFSFDHNERTSFATNTEAVNLLAKVMLKIPQSKFRVYSSAGIGNVHRKDLITNQWHLGPGFAVGLNYLFNEHIMAEVNGTYIAGFGESQLNPANTYIPFLYTGNLRLAYLF